MSIEWAIVIGFWIGLVVGASTATVIGLRAMDKLAKSLGKGENE